MIRPTTVAPGVERFAALTPTLPPATHTNSYALGTRDVVLVEPATPYEDERREWVTWARGLVSQGRRLVALFATHHHADHVGGVSFFREELGLELWAHERIETLSGHAVSRALVDGDQIVLDGPEPMKLDVLHTPGHASDHLCLYDAASKTLVVGDMVASVGTILIAPGDGDMLEYLAQLGRLEKLEANVALPAHGDPIEVPSRLFRAYQAHRAMREAWILKAVEQSKGGNLDELVTIAYADTKPELHPIARLSLEAHLLKLEREGRVRREGDRFVPAA
ncbi:MAG: MBL fold metallo-hydrolase [Polyangiaceae bacterium]|nr:MBL fold metallo-hydrolase [Polyangiaceae bacterium]